MILNFCAVCGSTEDLNHHHFTAKILGGSDDEKNILTLCYKHHCEIHNKPYRDVVNHRKLTRDGLQRAKERGVKLGNPQNLIEYNKRRVKNHRKYISIHRDLIISLQANGMTYREICKELERLGHKTNSGNNKWHPSQVGRIIKSKN